MKALNPQLASETNVTSAILFQHICYWMQTTGNETIFRTNAQMVDDLEGMFSESQIQRAKKKLVDFGVLLVTTNPKHKFDKTSHYSITEKGKLYFLSMNTKNTKSDVQITAKNTHISEVKSEVVQSHQEEAKTSTASLHEAVEGVKTLNTHKTTTIANKDDYKQECDALEAVQTPTTKKQWLPKEEWLKQRKQQFISEQQNKEMIVSRDMRKSFDEGFTGSKNATKGCPQELLNNPILAKMLGSNRGKRV